MIFKDEKVYQSQSVPLRGIICLRWLFDWKYSINPSLLICPFTAVHTKASWYFLSFCRIQNVAVTLVSSNRHARGVSKPVCSDLKVGKFEDADLANVEGESFTVPITRDVFAQLASGLGGLVLSGSFATLYKYDLPKIEVEMFFSENSDPETVNQGDSMCITKTLYVTPAVSLSLGCVFYKTWLKWASEGTPTLNG